MAIAICPSIIILLFVISMGLSCSAYAPTFYVGGDNNGWSLEPSENYTHWAERYRFQINDEIGIFLLYKLIHVIEQDSCNLNWYNFKN